MDYPANKQGGDRVDDANPSQITPGFVRSSVDRAGFDMLRTKLDKVIEESRSNKKVRGNKDEDRSQIALLFVWFFLAAIGAVLILVPVYNLYAFRHAPIAVDTKPAIQPLDLGAVLTDVGTILGPSVGFVVGYYFKDEFGNKSSNKASRD